MLQFFTPNSRPILGDAVSGGVFSGSDVLCLWSLHHQETQRSHHTKEPEERTKKKFMEVSSVLKGRFSSG